MSPPITVIGSTNVDLVMQLGRLPARGETVADGRFLQTFGGKGANQAVAAARAGGRVSFITAVGRDSFGDQALANFAADGIDTCCAVRADAPTGTALVLFDHQGDNYLAIAPGANDTLTPAHIDACAPQIASAAMLVLQMEIPLAATRRALDLAADLGVPVLFNYAPVRSLELPISAAMGGLVVNEVEATALTGIRVDDLPGAEAAAAKLLAHGPSFVVVTLGRRGAVLAAPSRRLAAPAFAVEPVDSTGAGDAFCGALAVALAEGAAPPEALRFACAAGSLAVTLVGAQPALPHRTAIESLVTAGRRATQS